MTVKGWPESMRSETTRDRIQRGDSGFDCGARNIEANAGGDGREQVINIDATDQARMDFHFADWSFRREVQAVRAERKLFSGYLSLWR